MDCYHSQLPWNLVQLMHIQYQGTILYHLDFLFEAFLWGFWQSPETLGVTEFSSVVASLYHLTLFQAPWSPFGLLFVPLLLLKICFQNMNVLMIGNVLLIVKLNLFMGSLFLICCSANIVSVLIFLLLPLLDFRCSSDLAMNTPTFMHIN